MVLSNFISDCFILIILTVAFPVNSTIFLEDITSDQLVILREEVRQMFQHGYDNYMLHAYPRDELCPLSCSGRDTWGGYSLTLIDSLDTLVVLGNYSEFRRAVGLVVSNYADLDVDVNVSVFETNIRLVGGLISAHLMLDIAEYPLPVGWPCDGPLLRLAVDVARRLLPAFNTSTGMPYGTVNLRHGVPAGETPVTCTAGVGTFLVEFGTLTRLTGDPVFERVAMSAITSLWSLRSPLNMLGNHIDVQRGVWTAVDAGIGAGVDSFYEYLVKGSQLLGRPSLMAMFEEARQAIDRYMRHEDWHMWVSMSRGQVTLPVFQSLEAFWPGVLALTGDHQRALSSLFNYYSVWRRWGFTPEFYHVIENRPVNGRAGYPLRPELAEALLHVYRATGSRQLLGMAKQLLRSIQLVARTPCGFATVKNVTTHQLEDRMESFFLAETIKYLYLLFDPENFLHSDGSWARLHRTERGTCLLHAGGYVFNTEAHPVDPAALACCSTPSSEELLTKLRSELKSSGRKKLFHAPKKPRPILPNGALTRNMTDTSDTCRRSSLLDVINHVIDGVVSSRDNQFWRLTCARTGTIEQRLMVGFETFS